MKIVRKGYMGLFVSLLFLMVVNSGSVYGLFRDLIKKKADEVRAKKKKWSSLFKKKAGVSSAEYKRLQQEEWKKAAHVLQKHKNGERVAFKIVSHGKGYNGKYLSCRGGGPLMIDGLLYNKKDDSLNPHVVVKLHGTGRWKGLHFKLLGGDNGWMVAQSNKKHGALVTAKFWNPTNEATNQMWDFVPEGRNFLIRSRRTDNSLRPEGPFAACDGHHGNAFRFRLERLPEKPPFEKGDIVAIKSVSADKYLAVSEEEVKATEDKPGGNALFEVLLARGNWVGFKSRTTGKNLQCDDQGIVRVNTQNFASEEEFQLDPESSGKFYIRSKNSDGFLKLTDVKTLKAPYQQQDRETDGLFKIEKITDVTPSKAEPEAKKEKLGPEEAKRLITKAEDVIAQAKKELDAILAKIKAALKDVKK